MVGNLLITIGLVLDIIGVALLLAGPRVHPRSSFLLGIGTNREGESRFRRVWSKLGRFGLPTVAIGFTLQIFGVWADDLSWSYLGPLIGLVVPFVFVLLYMLVRHLPYDG